METTLIIISILLCIVGFIGSIVPGLPGHPLNYLALWCLQWAIHPFTTITLIVFGILTVLVLVLDYLIPVWTGKKFGATRQGIIGSMIGMVAGMIFTPIGMLLGTFLGAIIGDMVAGRTTSQATRSGIATFMGTVISIGFKVALSGIMTFMIIYKLIIQA
ncbi:MAG: DUF456 domain-containing protein [Bacteroidota bacterium]